jgi:signal transduction histidine kinase
VQSRTEKDSRSTAEDAGPSPAAAGPDGPASSHEGPRARDGQPGAPPQADGQNRSGTGSRFALKNWRVRSRLLLLIIIPTLTAIALAGVHIYSSAQTAVAYQRLETQARLGQQVVFLTRDLEYERDQTVFYIAMGAAGGRAASPEGQALQRGVVERAFSTTDQAAGQFRSLARQIGSSYSTQTQQALATARTALSGLENLRNTSTTSQLPALAVVQKYTQLIDAVLALNDQIAQGAGDPTLAQTVRVLSLVSAMREDASQQRAILSAALLQGSFGAGQLAALQTAQSAQQSNLAAFNVAANVGQQRLWDNSVNQSFVYLTNSEELQALSLANQGKSLSGDPTSAVDWFGAMSNTIDFQMGSVEQHLAAAVTSRAATLRNNALVSALVVGAIVLVILALALLATVAVGRSMIRPLRRLRSGALDVAGNRLPEAVRRINESDGEGVPQEVVPIDVNSTDEIGEVARAFDQVHKEAIGLAGNEAALRGNVNAMFVNLSRRTQSLVQRQIHLIDDLEQGEQDSDRLGNLFRLDHLATRMRRNSENLLVLGGHEAAQRWSQPVALVDVLRAAVSEIEQYERVSLNVQPGISVRGQVVNDVVHLLAELLENATSFSSAETQVNVSGHLLNSGGVLLDITDRGVGMPADEMKDANWRLDNPPVVDVAVSRRMGLFVVARLASRHGIRVRLRPGPTGGLTALIWLPDETVTYEASGSPSGLQRFDADAAAAQFNGYPPPDAAAADGGSSREATVAAARVPRFTADGTDIGEGQLDSDGERTDDTGPVPSVGVQTAGSTNGLRGAQPASSRIDQAGQTGLPDLPDRRQWDDAGARSDSEARFGLTPRIGSWSRDSQAGDVVVPPGGNVGDNRLPIFESVESDWFRRGRHEAISAMSDQGEPAHRAAETANGWSSPADDGWRAAEAVESPSAAGLTPAGLPRRVPQANLVPGGVSEPQVAAYQAAPTRSAAATRQRMSNFQRGAREGRAALRSDESSGTESEEDA